MPYVTLYIQHTVSEHNVKSARNYSLMFEKIGTWTYLALVARSCHFGDAMLDLSVSKRRMNSLGRQANYY
jgi:hypothetical protein